MISGNQIHLSKLQGCLTHYVWFYCLCDILYDACNLLYFETIDVQFLFGPDSFLYIPSSYLLIDVRVLTINVKFGMCYKISVSWVSVNVWKRG